MANEYDIQAQVWRDEQPGDEAVLRVSARFAPKAGAPKPTRVVAVELWQRERVWKAAKSSWQDHGGEFEIQAEGAPPAAGPGPWELRVRFQTAKGERAVTAAVTRMQTIH